MDDTYHIDRRTLLFGAGPGLVVAGSADTGARLWDGSGMRSIRDFGVSSAVSASKNRRHLQDAIDWATGCGAGLWIEPSDEPYAIDSGIILRQNVSLIGIHGAVSRGTKHPLKDQPVGSVFRLESTDAPFLTVESATQLRGLQFWYPAQTIDQPSKTVAYPPTITRAPDQFVGGVTFSSLAFYGEYTTFDFRARIPKDGAETPSELILFEHCYGYPLSGQFISIDHCSDIPRILHCHVNPANRRAVANQDHSKEIVESVIDRRTFCYSIDRSDNAQLMDLFAFGVYGGVRLGSESYGQLTNFNLDCVTIGIHKSGSQTRNRNWQLAQGAIIANAGRETSQLHPLVIDGQGHTTVANVESFAGYNPVVNSPTTRLNGLDRIVSEDFLLVEGTSPMTVSLMGCRMGDFRSQHPITFGNPAATVTAHGCFTSSGEPPIAVPFADGIVAH